MSEMFVTAKGRTGGGLTCAQAPRGGRVGGLLSGCRGGTLNGCCGGTLSGC
jgi:hypothetical protein